MNVLIDTNVILDLLLNRLPFVTDANIIYRLAERKEIKGFVSASAITDIHYLLKRGLKTEAVVQNHIKQLSEVLTIAAVSQKEITDALSLHWNDFEDAVQYAVALNVNIDCIITRNAKDYLGSNIQVKTPFEFLETYFDEE
jgi:predicted nucleic acid-binding protein